MNTPLVYFLGFPIFAGILSALPVLFPALRKLLERKFWAFLFIVFTLAGIAFLIAFAFCYWISLDPLLHFMLASNPEEDKIWLQRTEIFKEAWLEVMSLYLFQRCFNTQAQICEYAAMLSQPFTVLISLAWVGGLISFATSVVCSLRFMKPEEKT